MFWRRQAKGRKRPATRPSHQLTVVRNGQPTKKRIYHVVSRMGGNHDLGVYNNTVAAVERAMVERYFLCKVGGRFLPAVRTTVAAWATPHLVEFRELCSVYVRERATVISLREVVNSYDGAKRRVYEAALRSLYHTPLNRKDADLCPFTKFEKQDLTKAPRIINPRSPRYNLVLGKYLKKAEKIYFAAINEVWRSCTDHTVIKGLNSFQSAAVLRAKWDRFRDPVAVGLDASKFDMHVSVHALKYEHEYYNGVFKSPELAKLLRWQCVNRGVARCPDGKVTFQMPGTRSSGDLNTSLGNCIIMCALIYELCVGLGVQAELANNGDDCVLFVERADLDEVLRSVPNFFARKGFRMTVEPPVDEFERLEFCQSQPVLLESGWCMVRNVRTCLRKDPMCLIPMPNDKVWRKWLGAVGECGAASVPGCPVLSSFYAAFSRSGVKATRRFKNHIFRNTGVIERMSGARGSITPISRASFAAAFGIPPDMQIALEKYFDQFVISGLIPGEEVDGLVETLAPPILGHL